MSTQVIVIGSCLIVIVILVMVMMQTKTPPPPPQYQEEIIKTPSGKYTPQAAPKQFDKEKIQTPRVMTAEEEAELNIAHIEHQRRMTEPRVINVVNADTQEMSHLAEMERHNSLFKK